MSKKKVVIIAGPNGAGKTTFAREFLPAGHDVPVDVIRRRFAAGMRNFLQSHRHRAHDWMLFDNSGPSPRLLEEGHNG